MQILKRYFPNHDESLKNNKFIHSGPDSHIKNQTEAESHGKPFCLIEWLFLIDILEITAYLFLKRKNVTSPFFVTEGIENRN